MLSGLYRKSLPTIAIETWNRAWWFRKDFISEEWWKGWWRILSKGVTCSSYLCFRKITLAADAEWRLQDSWEGYKLEMHCNNPDNWGLWPKLVCAQNRDRRYLQKSIVSGILSSSTFLLQPLLCSTSLCSSIPISFPLFLHIFHKYDYSLPFFKHPIHTWHHTPCHSQASRNEGSVCLNFCSLCCCSSGLSLPKSEPRTQAQHSTQLMNSVGIASGGQHWDSAIHTHVSILPQTPLLSRLPQNITVFLCCIVGPCGLSILNIAVCACRFQTH